MRLVSGTNIQTPRFSPSGKWISHSRSDELYIAPMSGGNPRTLGKLDGGSQWIPYRDELLVGSDEGLKIYSVAQGWTGAIPDASLPVVFSPDGREMVYADAVSSGVRADATPFSSGRLCRLAVEHPGEPEILFSKLDSQWFPVFWAGDYVIFQEGDFSVSGLADGLELFRIPAAGGAPQSLGVSALLDGDMLSLSAQGKLAVSVGDDREEWQNKRIAVIDPATAAISYLTETNTVAVTPVWSPAGDQVAFSAAPAPESDPLGDPADEKRVLAKRRIYVADPAGFAPPKPLTNDATYRDEEPMWSADGQHILICRIDSKDNNTLWLMNPDGSGLEQVAELYMDPAKDDSWFGYYGHIDWRNALDWFR